MNQTNHTGSQFRKEPDYEYYVWPERKILLRVSVGAVEQFCPASEEEWQANPALEGLRSGSGDFDFFDRIEEEEAMSSAAQFREAAKRTDRSINPSE